MKWGTEGRKGKKFAVEGIRMWRLDRNIPGRKRCRLKQIVY